MKVYTLPHQQVFTVYKLRGPRMYRGPEAYILCTVGGTQTDNRAMIPKWAPTST